MALKDVILDVNIILWEIVTQKMLDNKTKFLEDRIALITKQQKDIEDSGSDVKANDLYMKLTVKLNASIQELKHAKNTWTIGTCQQLGTIPGRVRIPVGKVWDDYFSRHILVEDERVIRILKMPPN